MKPKSGSERPGRFRRSCLESAQVLAEKKKRVEQPSISRSDWPHPVAEERVGRVIPDGGRSFSCVVCWSAVLM